LERTNRPSKGSLGTQIRRHASAPPVQRMEYEGDITKVVSTGSTLLDLAISGGRRRGGGIPGGILVEIFGPPSAGKTVLLCEVAGNVHDKGGQIKFYDPEGRLDTQFAKLFGLTITDKEYSQPNTPLDIFTPIRKWNPTPSGVIHGVFTDSIASLESDLEMADKKDEYSRVAKLLSQELRKTCRTISSKNFIIVCSNQLRQNVGASQFEPKYTSPGGEAVKFYSSLRLRMYNPKEITKEVVLKNRVVNAKGEVQTKTKEIEEAIGAYTLVKVVKNSTWKPWRTAPVYIVFDYGIDDIRANVTYLKQMRQTTTYELDKERLGISLDEAILYVEKHGLEEALREAVIDTWEQVEGMLSSQRKKKIR
jgi:recombination protein RecA